MNHTLYGNIATAITTVAYLPYIISILRGRTRPDKTTWSVLFLMGSVTFFAYKDVGAVATLGVALANVIGPFIIFLLSLKYGQGWGTKGELKYLLFSIIAIILWQIFDSPVLGLTFNLLADLIAFIPTIKKSYLDPLSEDKLAWSLFLVGGLINFLAIEQWIFSIIVYPLYIVLAEGAVALLLIFKPLAKKASKGEI